MRTKINDLSDEATTLHLSKQQSCLDRYRIAAWLNQYYNKQEQGQQGPLLLPWINFNPNMHK